jgi:hypothetical protein
VAKRQCGHIGALIIERVTFHAVHIQFTGTKPCSLNRELSNVRNKSSAGQTPSTVATPSYEKSQVAKSRELHFLLYPTELIETITTTALGADGMSFAYREGYWKPGKSLRERNH